MLLRYLNFRISLSLLLLYCLLVLLVSSLYLDRTRPNMNRNHNTASHCVLDCNGFAISFYFSVGSCFRIIVACACLIRRNRYKCGEQLIFTLSFTSLCSHWVFMGFVYSILLIMCWLFYDAKFNEHKWSA